MALDRIPLVLNDNILPSQFFSEGRNLSGCQRLLMAIFDEALETLRVTHAIHRQHHADVRWNTAVEWVLSDEIRYASFTFCCYHLDTEPDRVRQALRVRYGLELRIPYRQPAQWHERFVKKKAGEHSV